MTESNGTAGTSARSYAGILNKATRIDLFSFNTPQMRAFHVTWFAFFLCFFGWFGVAPLMAIVRDELMLTKVQIGNTIIASVTVTVFVRLLIGPLCDRFGPRRTYSALLILGSLPVMGIGFSHSYESFLLFRLAIGAIGASFVITQYHTSVMFAPNVVGTANATTAGWGNLGGGVTQMVMPLVFGSLLSLGVGEVFGWRLAMAVPGVCLFLTGIAYYRLTQDAPDGDFRDLRAQGLLPPPGNKDHGTFLMAARDYRVWALFVVYAACFGVELTINNVAALYFHDRFELSLGTAGLIAGLFGLMNIFARTLGGAFSDRFARWSGLRGRVRFLTFVLLVEGLALVAFSQMNVLWMAVASMVVFSLFVQMSEGATYGVVPFLNRRCLGAVTGIIGAGGNAGAVAAGFLFRSEALSTQQALMLLGITVIIGSAFTRLVRFSDETEAAESLALRVAVQEREAIGAMAASAD